MSDEMIPAPEHASTGETLIPQSPGSIRTWHIRGADGLVAIDRTLVDDIKRRAAL